MEKTKEVEKMEEMEEMEQVDLIASGYEWVCPNCELLNKEIEIPHSEIVECNNCGEKYEVGDHFHANQ